MRRILTPFGLLALTLSLPLPARATSCWQVTGWSSTAYVGAQALLVSAPCTTIPQSDGWVEVTLYYGSPPSDNLWLRIPLSDSRVSNWRFTPLLVFSHYDTSSKPVVLTDLIPCLDCTNEMWLLPFPPVQGVPAPGQRVRLRHRNTRECIYSFNTNGAAAHNWACWNDPGMLYILDDAGGGTYRLRHQQTSQCLYAGTVNGGPLYNWVCWADPNMRFQLVAQGGGYRLQHVSTSQCAYGNATNGGTVNTWGCWSDPNMVYNLDIVP
ncbi:MAG TPA: RICIN domain-containing protein [Thermoanaerobaculia bacterium]|nr:RICIN domain-containing protein [Thermoanaerobaculia bacterium]